MDITQRQSQLLLAIIKEFIESGEAVGSLNLQGKYDFNVSPATIRNEMSSLVEKGYLYMKHSSGGRIPTTKAWRFYVRNIKLNENQINVVVQEEVKTQLNILRFETEKLIMRSLDYLFNMTNNTSVALVGNNVYHVGLATMIKLPEFKDVSRLQGIIRLLEDYKALSDLFSNYENEDIAILIGEESGINELSDYTVIFTTLKVFEGKKAYVAVIGPNRMEYTNVIPAIKYITETITHLMRGWSE